jgi:hypothetical protein
MLLFQAIGVHVLFLVVEIFVGVLFIFACYKSRYLNGGGGQRQPVPGTSFSSPTKTSTSSPPVSSTPLKRRHSLEDASTCLLGDAHHVQDLNKRRRSLDCK